ncbi:MAG: hypothetical protein AAGH15_03935, partial [Myxococcota bacterium]
AGAAIQVLSLAGWVYLVATTYSALFMAAGEPKWVTVGDIVKGVLLVGGVPLGFYAAEGIEPGSGLQGALVALLMADIIRYGVTIALSKAKLQVWGRSLEFGLTLRMVVVAAPVMYLGKVMEEAELHIALRCFVIFVVVTAAWWPVLWPYVRDRLEARRAAKGS